MGARFVRSCLGPKNGHRIGCVFHRLELVYKPNLQTLVEPEQKPRPRKQRFHTGPHQGIGEFAGDCNDGNAIVDQEIVQT
jgi:hypothetical protein